MRLFYGLLTLSSLALLARPAEASATPWYADSDGDGYGTTLVTVSDSAPSGTTASRGDCDDNASAVHPGATESCDAVDNDCDGRTDEDNVCRWSGSVGTDVVWAIRTKVSSLGGVDLDNDRVNEAVIIGEDDRGSWHGNVERLDEDGLSRVVGGAASGDAMGYFPAISVEGQLFVTSVNADLGGTDSGAVYLVSGTSRGAAIYGNGRSGSTSAYNGDSADAGSGSVLVGFPSTGGADAGAAYVVTMGAAVTGGRVDKIATLALTTSTKGQKLGSRVGALDLDGDGRSELLVSDTSVVHVVPGGLTGSSAITSVETSELAYAGVSGLGSVDADGDGQEDLGIVEGSTLVILDATDVLAGSESPFATLSDVGEAVFGDLDGDGQDDLVWVTTAGTVSIAYGPFSGTITADATVTRPGVEHIALADIDSDGMQDVVFSTMAYQVYAIYGGP